MRAGPCSGPTGTRLAADALPDVRHGPRGAEVGVGDEVRVRNVDAAEILLAQLRCRGRGEQIVPGDVAGGQPPVLRPDQLPDSSGVARPGAERVGQAAEAADPELERVDEMRVLRAQRAGRVQPLGGRDELLMLLGVSVQGPHEGRLPNLGPRERRRELGSDPLRAVADLPDVLHVTGIPILFRLAPAARDPEDEEDHDEDREADEPDQPQKRGQAGRRALRTAGAARSPSRAFGLDGLPGCRLLEEVELDLGIALGHGARPGFRLIHLNDCIG